MFIEKPLPVAAEQTDQRRSVFRFGKNVFDRRIGEGADPALADDDSSVTVLRATPNIFASSTEVGIRNALPGLR